MSELLHKPVGILEYKTMTAEMEDVDLKKRIVTGYWAGFGNKDHDRDLMNMGVASKTIKERGPKGSNEIFFLNQHNWAQPLGKPVLLEERTKGIYHETPVTVETNYANDSLKCMAAGLVVQNSIGFVAVKWNYVNEDDYEKSYREIQEIKLYEGSCVTLGANPQTPFTGFKNLSLPKLNDQISKMVKLLKDGDLTDDGFIRLEIGLKQLQKEAFELGKNSVEKNQPEVSTDKTVNPDSNILKSLITVLERN